MNDVKAERIRELLQDKSARDGSTTLTMRRRLFKVGDEFAHLGHQQS
jgi:hypothetical protein